VRQRPTARQSNLVVFVTQGYVDGSVSGVDVMQDQECQLGRLPEDDWASCLTFCAVGFCAGFGSVAGSGCNGLMAIASHSTVLQCCFLPSWLCLLQRLLYTSMHCWLQDVL
jgi:hypothetical protein